MPCPLIRYWLSGGKAEEAGNLQLAFSISYVEEIPFKSGLSLNVAAVNLSEVLMNSG
jgi:hypothetical protein